VPRAPGVVVNVSVVTPPAGAAAEVTGRFVVYVRTVGPMPYALETV